MTLEELYNYCNTQDGVTTKTPFGKFARRYDSILVFYVLDHMFCIIDMNNFTFVNVKTTPDKDIELLETRTSASRPLNPGLRYWIQINFNGDIPDSEIYSLVKQSYEIIKTKYTKKSNKKQL